MQEKLYAVNILKYTRALRIGAIAGNALSSGVLQLAFTIKFRQFGHLPAIDLRWGEPQLLFKRLL